MGLRVHDTRTGEKRDFVPLEPGKVRMYVCGVTVYDLCHIGHARCYVAFDVIQRWLRRSYEVTYVRNFTDVDDKIIARANENGEDPIALASRFVDAFHQDMAALGVAQADLEPRVSTHIEPIAEFVDALVKKGVAYAVPSSYGEGSDVYYRVSSFPHYCDLSGRNLDDMQAGARVEVDERKESPLDFALWKSAKPGEPSWASPFGRGRPGWHIECSAMAAVHLGATFDIKGGGKDLIFPHHTNEIAQSEARFDKTYAQFYLHNGFVTVRDEERCPVTARAVAADDGGVVVEHEGVPYACVDADAAERFRASPETYLKMSKSLGNFFTIRDVLARNTAEALRWLLVGTHYRKPIAFGPALLDEAERRIAYLYETRRDVGRYLETQSATDGPDLAAVFGRPGAPYAPMGRVKEALDDDFNTAGAVAVLIEHLRIGNLLPRGHEKELIGRKLSPGDRARLLREWQSVLAEITTVLGVGQADPEAFLLAQRRQRVCVRGLDEGEIERLVQAREAARTAKDFARADEARAKLTALGVEVRDGVDGSSWTLT